MVFLLEVHILGLYFFPVSSQYGISYILYIVLQTTVQLRSFMKEKVNVHFISFNESSVD